MLIQRINIKAAFLIIAVIFTGFYIVYGFNLERKNVACGTIDDPFIKKDTTKEYKSGKALFQQCASCHILFKDFTGPDLIGFTKRGPWGDKKKILAYLNNPVKFYKENRTKYVEDLYNSRSVGHLVFLWNEKQIADFIYYLDSEEKNEKKKIE